MVIGPVTTVHFWKVRGIQFSLIVMHDRKIITFKFFLDDYKYMSRFSEIFILKYLEINVIILQSLPQGLGVTSHLLEQNINSKK